MCKGIYGDLEKFTYPLYIAQRQHRPSKIAYKNDHFLTSLVFDGVCFAFFFSSAFNACLFCVDFQTHLKKDRACVSESRAAAEIPVQPFFGKRTLERGCSVSLGFFWDRWFRAVLAEGLGDAEI